MKIFGNIFNENVNKSDSEVKTKDEYNVTDDEIILYHVTSKENTSSILDNGLVPGIGARAELVGEEEELIYLCNKEDILKWMIMLNVDRVVEVRVSKKDMKYFDYSSYKEYICPVNISPERLRVINFEVSQKQYKDTMKELCKFYLFSMTKLIMQICIYYNHHPFLKLKNIDNNLKGTLFVLRNLNYTMLSREEICETLLASSAKGETTFLDYYNNSEKRLYQKILDFDWDVSMLNRLRLYRFISMTFDECLDIDTGGWEVPDYAKSISEEELLEDTNEF